MSTNSRKLSGKVAIVTGASKGIGASIAKHLAAEGARVVVNYASSKEGADRVVADITAAGGKAIAVQANVAKKTEIERLFAESEKAFGQLDILVNNAGIYEVAPLGQITEEHFHALFNLNVLGLTLLRRKHSTTSGRMAEALSTSARLSAPPRPLGQRFTTQPNRPWTG
jgi:3-oxoacyl-[acyl-carrier protein] reductase